MDKESLKKKTLETVEFLHQRYIEQIDKVIDHMDADSIEAWDDNYFLPKAFAEALHYMNTEHVTSRSYSVAYTRKWKNAVRSFQREIRDIL